MYPSHERHCFQENLLQKTYKFGGEYGRLSTIIILALAVLAVVAFLSGRRGIALILAALLIVFLLLMFTKTRSFPMGEESSEGGGFFGAIGDFFEGIFGGGAKEAAQNTPLE